MFPRTIRRSFIPQRCIRQFQSSALRPMPSKAGQDKDSIDTTSNEYSKSGGDGQAAGEAAAFDPNTTRPETEMEESGNGSVSLHFVYTWPRMYEWLMCCEQDGKNPLNASPANHEISHTNTEGQQGKAQGSKDETGSGSGRQRTSGGGGPTKSGGGQSGGGTAG